MRVGLPFEFDCAQVVKVPTVPNNLGQHPPLYSTYLSNLEDENIFQTLSTTRGRGPFPCTAVCVRINTGSACCSVTHRMHGLIMAYTAADTGDTPHGRWLCAIGHWLIIVCIFRGLGTIRATGGALWKEFL